MKNLEKLGLIVKENEALRIENARLKQRVWHYEHTANLDAFERDARAFFKDMNERALAAGFEVVAFDGELCARQLEFDVRVFE